MKLFVWNVRSPATQSKKLNGNERIANCQMIFDKKCFQTVPWSSRACRRKAMQACTRVQRGINKDTAREDRETSQWSVRHYVRSAIPRLFQIVSIPSGRHQAWKWLAIIRWNKNKKRKNHLRFWKNRYYPSSNVVQKQEKEEKRNRKKEDIF